MRHSGIVRIMAAVDATAAGETRRRRAPLAGVTLVAAGAALWGTDGALRKPLSTEWSP